MMMMTKFSWMEGTFTFNWNVSMWSYILIQIKGNELSISPIWNCRHVRAKGKNSSGLSRLRNGLTQNGINGLGRVGRNGGWTKNLRSGSAAQFLSTLTLCAIFFGMVQISLWKTWYHDKNLNDNFIKIQYFCNNKTNTFQGLTKSLINLQVDMERKDGPSPKETANSVGYVVGFVFGMVFKPIKIAIMAAVFRDFQLLIDEINNF